jgi:hypothetical protein
MEKIRTVSGLPEWFRNRTYRQGLGKVDWYREISARQIVAHLISMRPSDVPIPDTSKEILMVMITEPKVHPHSYAYDVPQYNHPINDLTAGEAIYFRPVLRDVDLIYLAEKFDDLLALWLRALQENPDGPTPLFGEYESRLADFFKELQVDERADKLDKPIIESLDGVGNPWLSYGRPLNGFPITVDTQYDDETLVNSFRDWLSKNRAAAGERMKRPFNQNDLNDWENYRIRELFDLQTWSRLTGVKIQDNVIALALWPDAPDDFSPIDVLRTTARKKVKEVINYEVVVRLYGQLLLELGENFLEQ